jgi:glycerophosphoryl diester phosphodiesterase
MPTKLIAHRGASHIAPENTFAAINKAFASNISGVEIDIHLTKDNYLAVVHDNNLSRLAGVDINVEDSLWNEIKDLDVGSWKDPIFKGEKIPLLHEVLELLPNNFKLFIEIKSSTPQIITELKKTFQNFPHKKSQLVVISFNWDLLDEFKKLNCNIDCMYILEEKDLNKIFSDSSDNLYDRAKNNFISGFDFELSHSINEEFINKLKNLNFKTVLWCYGRNDNLENYLKYSRTQIDYYTTNHVNFNESHQG